MKQSPIVEATELPRLFRPTIAADMPTPNTLAVLDKQLNILRINSDLWDSLSEKQQREVMRTQSDEIVSV